MPDSVNSYLSGLDTLSEHQLLRVTAEWTGQLTPTESVDTTSVDGVVGREAFNSMVEQWRAARDVYRGAEAGSIFGDGSTLAEGVALVDDFATTTVADKGFASFMELLPNVMLNILILMLSISYVYCIYRYYYDAIALIQTALRSDMRVSDRVNERRRSDIFYGFLGKLLLLGIAFVGVFVAFWAIRHSDTVAALSLQHKLISPVVGIALFVVVALAQYLILFIVGLVTCSSAVTSTLTQMRLTYFVLATIIVSPLLLVAQVANSYDAWYIVTIITACVVLILYLRESLGVFISKKISILHWFLYLCTVEILPLTLLWQIAVRLG